MTLKTQKKDFNDLYLAEGLEEVSRQIRIALQVVPAQTAITARELMATIFPEPRWAVPGIVPQGLTILAGKPKMGKIWLGLGLCLSVAFGGKALGQVTVEKGTALYLALEDGPRRVKGRLGALLQGAEAPEDLWLQTHWRKLNVGGLEDLGSWLTQHPEIRLIVIDTLQRVRPKETGRGSQYDHDYTALEGLQTLAHKHNCAIVVIHHLRKSVSEAGDVFDEVSGTLGLTGCADTVLVLKRARAEADGVLSITGRDVEESEKALRFEREIMSWVLMGDAAEFQQSEQRRQILNALDEAGEPMTPKQIAEALGTGKYGSIRHLVRRMVKEGILSSTAKGAYSPFTYQHIWPVTAGDSARM
jgi:RecA-family ATPase